MLGLQHERAAEGPAAGPGSGSGSAAASPSDTEIDAQITARQAAKAARNFKEADRIRDGLKTEGIELIDRPGGVTEWIRG